MALTFKRFMIIISAIALAIFSLFFLKGWYNVVPWALGSIIAGYFSFSRKDIIINGCLFGYFLFVFYILIGYNGKADPKSILNIFVFSSLFSLIGAIAGIIGAFAGNYLRKKLKK
jgi:hypothetical protein